MLTRPAPQPRAAVGGTVEKAKDPLLRQEAAARASGTMLRVRLLPQRAHTGGAGEDHVRRTESQYFRMLRAVPAANMVAPEAVEYCYQPRLVAAFEAKRVEFDARYGRGGHTEVLLFHGTPKSANVESIVTGGFDMSKVGSTTDEGYYGAGAYLSELTSVSLAYAHSCGKMLMCRVLLGKPYLVDINSELDLSGKPCVRGHDSHVVDLNFSEVVIFDSAQILPCYIQHLQKQAPPAHAGLGAGLFGGGPMAGAGYGGGGGGGGGPLGGVAGMSAATPAGHHAAAAVFNPKPLEQAREFFDEQAAKRKRQREAEAAAAEANMARAMELSKSSAVEEAAAAKDFEAQLARALEASRATAAAERARPAQQRE